MHVYSLYLNNLTDIDGLPRWCSGKDLFANAGDAGDTGLISGLGRSPGVGNSNPLQFFLPEKFHGQRSLVGSGGQEESDTTE